MRRSSPPKPSPVQPRTRRLPEPRDEAEPRPPPTDRARPSTKAGGAHRPLRQPATNRNGGVHSPRPPGPTARPSGGAPHPRRTRPRAAPTRHTPTRPGRPPRPEPREGRESVQRAGPNESSESAAGGVLIGAPAPCKAVLLTLLRKICALLGWSCTLICTGRAPQSCIPLAPAPAPPRLARSRRRPSASPVRVLEVGVPRRPGPRSASPGRFGGRPRREPASS